MKRYKEYILESLGPNKRYPVFKVKDKYKMSLEEYWWTAISNCNVYDLKYAKNKGIDVNIKDKDGLTGLMYAVYNKENYMVETLLSFPGIDVNYRILQRNNAILIAATNKYINILKMLLEHPEIDITVKNSKGDIIDNLRYNTVDDEVDKLIDYNMQKKIIENGREDILFFFDKYNLVDPKIKEDHPDLFKAKDWGLI